MTNDGILFDLPSGNQTWLAGTSHINRVNMEVLIRKKHHLYMDLPNGFAKWICQMDLPLPFAFWIYKSMVTPWDEWYYVIHIYINNPFRNLQYLNRSSYIDIEFEPKLWHIIVHANKKGYMLIERRNVYGWSMCPFTMDSRCPR